MRASPPSRPSISRASPRWTQFVKGVEQIAQEGAIQIFKELGGGMEEVIVGVVGVLQFEVLEYRLKNEYNVDVRRTALPYAFIRWIDNEDIDPKALNLTSDTRRVEDFKGRRLLLFTSAWKSTTPACAFQRLAETEFSRLKIKRARARGLRARALCVSAVRPEGAG